MPDTAQLEPQTTAALPLGRTDHGEFVLSNGVSGEAALTVCVPCYRDSADALIAMLVRMPEAKRATLILFDDGSGDEALTRVLASHIMAFPGPARLVTAPANTGRAHARNRLVALAETDWILFLDADMRPDDDQFLARYLDAIRCTDGGALIAGGFSLRHVKPNRETALHAAQSAASECLDAEARGKDAGRYVFTSNILVHTDVLKTVGFDDGYSGWGWEDVDWGLRVAHAFPVIHIENPATHLGLDPAPALLDKFGTSGANFARLAERHPDAVKAMPLYRAARRVRWLPLRGMWRSLSKGLAANTAMPMQLRLGGLKLYRALAYAEHLK